MGCSVTLVLDRSSSDGDVEAEVLACQLSRWGTSGDLAEITAETITLPVGPRPVFGRWRVVEVTDTQVSVQVSHAALPTGLAFSPEFEDVPSDEAIVDVTASLVPVGSLLRVDVLRFPDN